MKRENFDKLKIVDKQYYELKREFYDCNICSMLVNDPKCCSECNFLYCNSCLSSSIKYHNTCPNKCNSFTKVEVKEPTLYLKKNLKSLELLCECGVMISLLEANNHINFCKRHKKKDVTCWNCHSLSIKEDIRISERLYDIVSQGHNKNTSRNIEDQQNNFSERETLLQELSRYYSELKVKNDELKKFYFDLNYINGIKKMLRNLEAQLMRGSPASKLLDDIAAHEDRIEYLQSMIDKIIKIVSNPVESEKTSVIKENVEKNTKPLNPKQEIYYGDIENIDEVMNNDELKMGLIKYKVTTPTKYTDFVKTVVITTKCQDMHAVNIMESIDRADFMPKQTSSYKDTAVMIGWNTTITAPHMHLITLNYIKIYLRNLPLSGLKGIDIGCGSGYMTLAISKILGPSSTVYALDHIQDILDYCKNNIAKNHREYVENSRIKFVKEDGFNGYAAGGPYHLIHVGAACKEIPNKLIDQLHVNGMMWIPIGSKNNQQKLYYVTKDKDGKISMQALMTVSFAEMQSVEEQLKSR